LIETESVSKELFEMNRIKLLQASIFILLGCATAFAQEATIVGTVFDPSGAAIPNVAITAKNVETGQTRTIKTSDSGQYVLPNLNIGRYRKTSVCRLATANAWT
jgi:Carboxypeptidase regulatory-like domain